MLLFGLTVRDLWTLRAFRRRDGAGARRKPGLAGGATRICLVAFMMFSLFADLWDLIFSYLLLGTRRGADQALPARCSAAPA